MNLRLSAYLAIRLAASSVLSTLLAFGIFKAAEVRLLESLVVPVFKVWWNTGKYVALSLSHLLPQDWIHGDPKSEMYWPAASAAGFLVLSCVVAWTIIIFIIWLALGRYAWPKFKHRSNNRASPGASGREGQISMNLHILSATFLAALILAQPVFAQSSLYMISSKAQGAPFDLVVTETKREPSKSYLSVRGFHERSAPGSRWLMCAYTDLAVKRGFSHWIVVYPDTNSEVLVVGFANSPNVSVKELLGEDFNKERSLGESVLSVKKFFPMCGVRR